MQTSNLLIFPTELARRQFIQRQVLKSGFVDTSNWITWTTLRNACEQRAREMGLVQHPAPSPIAQTLLIRNVAEEVHQLLDKSGPLATLSANALADVLEDLISTLSPFGDNADAVLETNLEGDALKATQLHQLYQTYRKKLHAKSFVDQRDINATLLKLLQQPREEWPALLRQSQGELHFTAMRWLNPFEESLIAILKTQLGHDRVKVFSALPPAHAEKMQDRLSNQVRSELMGSETEQQWTNWTEDLSDAMELQDATIALDSRDHVSFSRAAGLYGEVEDIARRICYEISEHARQPQRIALVVRNVSDYADATANVFKRFGIPYYIRRGVSAASNPLVKTLLNLLSFPLQPTRDHFIDLVRSPLLNWPTRLPPKMRGALGNDISESGVGLTINSEELITCLTAYYGGKKVHQEKLAFVKEAIKQLQQIDKSGALTQLAQRVRQLIEQFRIGESIPASIPFATAILNQRGLEAVVQTAQQFEEAGAGNKAKMKWSDFYDLLEKSLENATVASLDSTEAGVWVLNPFDLAGLDFDVVIIAGLNSGTFPATHRQDSLFSDEERKTVLEKLKTQHIHLPLWSLPVTQVRSIQENILFLIALGAAREELALSYQAADNRGAERFASEFFRSVWHVAGAPAATAFILHTYDEWRSTQLGEKNFITQHATHQTQLSAEEREPIPGESFQTTIPLALCRAQDETLQRYIHLPLEGPAPAGLKNNEFIASTTTTLEGLSPLRPGSNQESESTTIAPEAWGPPSSFAEHLHQCLDIESQRDAFNANPTDFSYAPYNALLNPENFSTKINTWLKRRGRLSPSAIETLAHCRYRFLLSTVFRLREPDQQDDTLDRRHRGTIVHDIMHHLYAALQGNTKELATFAPNLAARLAKQFQPRLWLINDNGTWEKITSAKSNAFPLTDLSLIGPEEMESLLTEIAEAVFAKAEQPGAKVMTGHPHIWETQKPKLLSMARNFALNDLDHADTHFPMLFEFDFGPRTASGVPLNTQLQIAGIIDRVDAVFDGDRLQEILVIDYKGTSKKKGIPQLLQDIETNLDSQLPLYAFAVQRLLFGEHNKDEHNEFMKALYYVYHQRLKDVGAQYKNQLQLSENTEAGRLITEVFNETLTENLNRIRLGNFAVQPLDCTYCDFEHICRIPHKVSQKDGGA